MLLINHRLAITNGQDYERVYMDGTERIVGVGSYANGTRYCLYKMGFGTRTVIETPTLVEDTSDEGILKAIEEGKLDIFPLTTYGGKNCVLLLKERVSEKLIASKRKLFFDQGLAVLNEQYPQVTQDIRDMLSNHDWYYMYSDDVNVYRSGKDQRDKIMDLLSAVDAKDYYSEYFKLISAK